MLMFRLPLLSTVVAAEAWAGDSLSLLQTSAEARKRHMVSQRDVDVGVTCKEAKAALKDKGAQVRTGRAALRAAKKAAKEAREAMSNLRSEFQELMSQRDEVCVRKKPKYDETGPASLPEVVEGEGTCPPIIYPDEPGHLWDLAPPCDSGLWMAGEYQQPEDRPWIHSNPWVGFYPQTAEGYQQCIDDAKEKPECENATVLQMLSCLEKKPKVGCACMARKSNERIMTSATGGHAIREPDGEFHFPPHQLLRDAKYAYCSLLSPNEWVAETKKAMNAEVKTLATDCEVGFSYTRLDTRDVSGIGAVPGVRLAQLQPAPSWEACLARAKADPRCNDAMAISWQKGQLVGQVPRSGPPVANCECSKWYSGATVDVNWQSCVIKDKFKGDAPAFSEKAKLWMPQGKSYKETQTACQTAGGGACVNTR